MNARNPANERQKYHVTVVALHFLCVCVCAYRMIFETRFKPIGLRLIHNDGSHDPATTNIWQRARPAYILYWSCFRIR